MGQDYALFVEKFEPKKTTDDCYTPGPVYEAVRNWAVQEYHLEGREIVRPFWPGGDYERHEYPPDCVVIDNPPFSLLAKIKEFYQRRGIRYFLFAPHLTLFSGGGKHGESYILIDLDVIYENGARVNTGFITNMDAAFIRTAPQLRSAVIEANKEFTRGKERPKYKYPQTVISAASLGKVANTEFRLNRGECSFVRGLDSQRGSKRAIFGGGFFISELRAAELRAAELRAAVEVIEFELSEREREIIALLGQHPPTEKSPAKEKQAPTKTPSPETEWRQETWL